MDKKQNLLLLAAAAKSKSASAQRKIGRDQVPQPFDDHLHNL